MVQHPTCISFLFQYKLTVPKMGNVGDLLAVLTKETNIPTDKVGLVLCVSYKFIYSNVADILKQLLPRLLFWSKTNLNTN